MSEARELLKEASKQLFEYWNNYWNDVDCKSPVFRLYKKIDAYLAKPEPEPTAYLYKWDDESEIGVFQNKQPDLAYRQDAVEIPLYAEPPARKSLSDEEIITIALKVTQKAGKEWITYDYIKNESVIINLLRAIEKAHGIGE